MHFDVTQRFAAKPAAVAAAFTDPALYERLAALPKVGRPEVLDRTVDGPQVRLRVRYQFTGDLSPAVRAVLDPTKLTWVEVTDHDLSARTVSFTLEPDNYRDRLSCAGTYRFESATGAAATLRTTSGELSVRAPLVARQVERAILSGLREHLDAEVAVVEEFLGGASTRRSAR